MGIENFEWFQTAGPIPSAWRKIKARNTVHKRTAWILSHLINKPASCVMMSGWPDLLVERNGEIFALEVKGPGDRLSYNQKKIHDLLRKAGLRVGVVYVDSCGSILKVVGLEIK
jgi:hypothetical protein